MLLHQKYLEIIKTHKLKKPSDIHIFVAGDLMLDHYITGHVNRISPEAPVPVVEVANEYYTLGGAGNVIQNLNHLGVNVSCVGLIGDDTHGEMLESILTSSGVNHNLIKDKTRPTTRKSRVVTQDGVQLLRVDRELKYDFSLDYISHHFYIPEEVEYIIVSDYAKGFITQKLMDRLRSFEKKIIVDPKPENSKLYSGVSMITPNKKEYQEMQCYDCQFTLETLGKDGMQLRDHNQTILQKIHGKEVKIFNVSGCGDTVISVLSICQSMGIDLISSLKIANECAGIVASKPGTSPISKSEFEGAVVDIFQPEEEK